jgi:pilus assembly protein CpaB
MSRITKTIAVILILLAALMAGLAWRLGNQAPQSVPVVTDKTAGKVTAHTTVVAAKKLEKGKPINAEDIKTIDMPQKVPGTYPVATSVIGKIPMSDIVADTLVMESNLVNGLALKLADGERAVAIAVDEVVGVGNKIEAGDYVDVFVTLKQGSDIDKGQSRLLASRRHVLAYGPAVIGAPAANNTVLSGNQSSQQAPARSAVLAVPVEQVNALLLATQNGKLTLALRHPGDTGIANHALFNQPDNVLSARNGLSESEQVAARSSDNQAYAGTDLTSWANNNSKARAGPMTVASMPGVKSQRPSSNTVEVIKGTQRENVNF